MDRHGGITLEEFEAEMLRDPEFRKVWAPKAPRYDLAEALIKLRLAAGLTQEQLAERLGTKKQAITRIENKPGNLTLRTLARIAAAAGTDFSIRFGSAGAGCIEVKIPAATMRKNGTLDGFE